MVHQNNISKRDYSIAKSPIVVSAESKILAWIALRDESVKKQLKKLEAEGFEWESLLGLARRHRMVPLLYHAIENNWIARPPDSLLSTLSDEVRVHWLQAANRSYDQRRLLASFQSENISVIVLKGTPLSYRLYGNFALRHSIDIDLLIHPTDKKKALSILFKQGYRLLDPFKSKAIEWYLENVEHKLQLIHPIKKTNIELSCWLHQQTKSPPLNLFYSDAKEIINPIYKLTQHEEVKDLLAHGAKHGWERFKWLTDIWRAWECYDVDWDKWQNDIRKSGLETALQSALLLHEWIIPDHPLPKEISLKRNPSTSSKLVARWAIRQIAGDSYSVRIENRKIIHMFISASVKFYAQTPSYRWIKVRHSYLNFRDIGVLNLPSWAYKFHPLLKPITFGLRYIKTIPDLSLKYEIPSNSLQKQNGLQGGQYQLFGMKVSSEMNLPLDRCDSNKAPDVTIRITDQLPDQENGMDWLAEIPATGSILLKGNHSIYMKPAPAVHPGNLRLWLLGSTLGALCWRRGWIPLHATSVRFKDRVVMISGPSGVGKSTLAAACLAEGAELYSDDISPVYLNESGEPELPGSGLRRFKLWPDAAERFETGAEMVGVVEKGMEKLEYRPPHIQDKPEKANLFICLEDDPEVKIYGRLNGLESLRAITENLFYIGLMPELMKAQAMKNIAELSKKITVIRIQRPGGLDEVEILAKQLASGWTGGEEI